MKRHQFQVISTLGWTPMALLITCRSKIRKTTGDSKQRNRGIVMGIWPKVDRHLHDYHVFMGYIWWYMGICPFKNMTISDSQTIWGSCFLRTGLTKVVQMICMSFRDFCPPSVELQACQADSFIGQLAKGEGGLRVAHVHHDPQSQWIALQGRKPNMGVNDDRGPSKIEMRSSYFYIVSIFVQSIDL